MNEHNPPMVLPNGQVYSLEALQEQSDRNNGKVYDPVNKAEF